MKLLRTEKWAMGQNVKVIECESCKSEVYLQSGWANECTSCPAEYNGFGQRLAPRSQWGEETGETEADFLDMESGDGYGYFEE